MPTTLKSIRDYVPEVVSQVSGATDTEILFALRAAVRKFLQRTELWVEELPDVNLVAAQRTYYPVISYDADIARILWLKAKNATSDDFELMDNINEERYDLVENNGIYFNEAVYAPGYTVVSGMRIKAVLVPTIESLELPIKIANEYIETIIYGAKEILARTPNRPYTDLKAESDNRFLYNSGLNSALAEKSRNRKSKSRGISA